MKKVYGELSEYLTGWKQHFRFANTPKVFRELDSWIRRRLRQVHLKQWKRGKPTYRALRRLGASEVLARQVASRTRHSEAISLGRRLLNKTLSSFGYHLSNIPKEKVGGLLEETNFEVLDDLLEDIGLGNRMAFIVARRLIPNEDGAKAEPSATHTGSDTALAIRGSEGLLMTYAKCCHPIPGDPIVGYVSAGRGMIVHTENCNNVAEIRNDPKKYVSLRWDPGVEGEFTVELRVEVQHQRGIIATIANAVTGSEANIEKMTTTDKDAQFSTVNLTLAVRNRIHLARVMKRLRILKSVTRVTRVKN